jgi:acyl-CoA synthetase (AMP-forming)/AMP-acid ligase II
MATIYEVVSAHAQVQPDKLALLTEEDGTRTFGELAERAGRLAWSLHSTVGTEPGARMSIWLPQTPEWIESALAASAAGVSLVAANPRWTDAEYTYILGHSRTRTILTDTEHAERALALRDAIPGLDTVIVTDGDVPGTIPFADLVSDSPDTFRTQLPDVGDLAEGSLNYTSGTTTGRPKAVMFRQVHMPGNIDFRDMWGLAPTDRCITVSPFFHGNGLYGGVFGALGHGASVVFPRRFSASRFWHLVDKYRPTYFVTLSAIMNILLSLEPDAVERDNTLRVLVVLGSAANAEEIEARYQRPLMDWYGLTEGGAGVYTPLDLPKKKGSAGIRFPGSTMTVLRDDLTEADPGEIGEVAFRADSALFQGYVDDPEATAAVLHDGWVWTGDLGYFDADGYFFFTDRKKDIVRRGGENISSVEVETVLLAHPTVAEAAVVAQPHPVLGEELAAFVVPAEGATPAPADLVAWCKKHLADFKAPEHYYAIDALPRTGTNKIEKFRLRNLIATGEARPL